MKSLLWLFIIVFNSDFFKNSSILIYNLLILACIIGFRMYRTCSRLRYHFLIDCCMTSWTDTLSPLCLTKSASSESRGGWSSDGRKRSNFYDLLSARVLVLLAGCLPVPLNKSLKLASTMQISYEIVAPDVQNSPTLKVVNCQLKTERTADSPYM